MTNVPVKRGEAARQQPQVATTDADREAGMALDVLHHELIEGGDFHCANRVCVEAIARARAEGAASEREACAEYAGNYALFGRNGGRIAAAIRARSEGGKA